MKNMTRKLLMPKFLLAIFALSGMMVFAANNETVSRALNIARPDVKVQISGTVVRAGKSVSFDKSATVSAGETLNWKVVSVNSGAGDAQNYRVVSRIPQGTNFVAGSANGENSPEVAYSIDGGKSFSAQPLIEEKQADGSVKQVPAPVSSYTQIRFDWSQSLPSQGTLNAAYQVQVK